MTQPTSEHIPDTVDGYSNPSGPATLRARTSRVTWRLAMWRAARVHVPTCGDGPC